MKKTKVAINGFGRIGRITLRALLKKPNVEVIAINDLADPKTAAHLFKYDSIHRSFEGEVCAGKDYISINDHKIKVLSCKDPSQLPWKELMIDIVIESTGLFRKEEEAGKHLTAGAKRVIISAPASGKNIKSVVLGVNDHILNGNENIISNASCTTNCAAPMIKVLEDNWGIETGFITTIHSYTTDQKLHDAPHADLRRARAAASSIVPTSTGAAKAITKIFPHLEGKVGGCGIRVPVPNGSLTDITCILKKSTDVNSINRAFRITSETSLMGILQFIEVPVVSVDIVGNTHSCIVDAELTTVMDKMVKVVGWYDNEMGYSSRLADLVEKLS